MEVNGFSLIFLNLNENLPIWVSNVLQLVDFRLISPSQPHPYAALPLNLYIATIVWPNK